MSDSVAVFICERYEIGKFIIVGVSFHFSSIATVSYNIDLVTVRLLRNDSSSFPLSSSRSRLSIDCNINHGASIPTALPPPPDLEMKFTLYYDVKPKWLREVVNTSEALQVLFLGESVWYSRSRLRM